MLTCTDASIVLLVAMLSMAGCAAEQPGVREPSGEASAAGPIGAGPLSTGSPPASTAPDDPTLATDCGGRPTAVGVTGETRTLLVSARRCRVAAEGHEYWLIVRSRDRYYPKFALPGGLGRTVRRLQLGPGAARGSYRSVLIGDVPAASQGWMRDAIENDETGRLWNGDRRALTADVRVVSDEARSQLTG